MEFFFTFLCNFYCENVFFIMLAGLFSIFYSLVEDFCKFPTDILEFLFYFFAINDNRKFAVDILKVSFFPMVNEVCKYAIDVFYPLLVFLATTDACKYFDKNVKNVQQCVLIFVFML